MWEKLQPAFSKVARTRKMHFEQKQQQAPDVSSQLSFLALAIYLPMTWSIAHVRGSLHGYFCVVQSRLYNEGHGSKHEYVVQVCARRLGREFRVE